MMTPSEHYGDRMQVGTAVRTTYEHSFTGVVVRPRRENLPLISKDWRIVKTDTGAHQIHISMMSERN